MNKLKLAFIFLLLGLSACKDESEESMAKEDSAIALTAKVPDVVFTRLDQVGSGLSSTAIMDRLVSMVNAAPAKSSVHLCIFGFSHPELISALRKASDRGVNLHLMVDMSREETKIENPPAVNEIRAFLKPNSEMVVVTSDAGNSSINHNKFVLFSKLSTASGEMGKVVFQTSHNFSVADSKKIQDAVILSNQGLYNAYKGYWEDMKAKAASGMKNFEYREFEDPAAGISALFFPKRKSGKNYGADSIIEILNQITDPSSALIRIGMSDWTAARLNVITKLEELLNKGATVEVIAKSKADDEILAGLENLKRKGAYVKIYNLTASNQLKINIHAKFMLIKGVWKGEQTNLVVTGTHNYTGNTVYYNNEVILLLKNNPQFFDAYMAYYNEMKKLPGLVR
ncbi:phosphatidylserine/phosphatidylglycerophosphate/cardiolipin synthase family protein [Rufibacter glacialis]|uniref:phospholipase D n=1 Tax=Rufibacter glacialis TaxID=1259555 RepID=A0A5M8QK32_9BACT|nr:phospholipase D-like domain-containing protein [Rufibacter glacialis]KAA6435350.1 hypothetical protein FOE74_05195 [Rufibacter glacialis]GGK62610.1 hypothetical protein GCM10011405_08370 [Rufibacter glacialis]